MCVILIITTFYMKILIIKTAELNAVQLIFGFKYRGTTC